MDRIKPYLSFQGRAGRGQYWLVAFATWAGLLLCSLLAYSLGVWSAVIILPLYVLVLWASLAASVRRIHDRGRSGWWLLVMLGPVIVFSALGASGTGAGGDPSPFTILAIPFSFWVLIDLGCMAGTPGPNRYGPAQGAPLAAADVFD